MKHSPPPNISEDYKVSAKLSVDHRKFTVPCKLFLPKTILEKPQVYIFPEPKQFDTLPRIIHKSCFKATIGDAPDIEIVGENTHISGGSMRHWEKGLEEGYLKIYPARLKIRHFRETNNNNTVLFRLTPSLHLSPWDSREYRYTGEVNIRHGKRLRFKLKDNFNITFLNHYKWQEIERKKTITFSELIAQASFTCLETEDDIDHYLSILDDFLLLVSFAEGQRCIIPQLNIYLSDKFVEIFQLDRSLPNISDNHSFNDFIIDTKDLEEFLSGAWKIFQESNQHELIKAALEINTSDSHMTMESHFLSLFSSIETLILAFRIESDLEYMFNDQGDWKKFRDAVKKLVKVHDSFRNHKDSRALMYQNINGLNRLPLNYAFKKFVTKNNLELNDLWPFSSDKDDWSLTTIRNRLVHGYRLGERYIDSFGEALDNLECYAKRFLLVVLGWDFNNSKLFRRDDSFIKSWEKARNVIRNWQ
jgi:hypothetical protein